MNKSRLIIIITTILLILLVVCTTVYLTITNDKKEYLSGYWRLSQVDVYDNGTLFSSEKKDSALLYIDDEVVSSTHIIDEETFSGKYYYFLKDNTMYWSMEYFDNEDDYSRYEYERIGDTLSIVNKFNLERSHVYVFKEITKEDYEQNK